MRGAVADSSLASARLVTLYLLSFLTISSAGLAWRPPRPGWLGAAAFLTALAVVLGGVLSNALSGVGSAGVRRRARWLAFLFVPVPTLLASMLPWGLPDLGAQVAFGLALLQLAILLVADVLGLEGLVLWGAFVLALTAAAGGILTGAVALVALLALSGVFFALDHVAVKLSSWPGAPAPALKPVLVEALRLVALPVALLAGVLPVLAALSWAFPSEIGLTPRGDIHVQAPEVQQAYQWLILLGLVGAGGLLLAFRLLKGRGKEARPLIEREETHVEAEEILEAPDLDDPRYAAARGRVIRAYVRFLTRAREAGLRLEPFLTPREIEGRVRRPEQPLDLLTGLFMDARYGPDEPGDESAHQAEVASRAVVASLARRSTRRATLRGARD